MFPIRINLIYSFWIKGGVEVGASLPGTNAANIINLLKEEKLNGYFILYHRHSKDSHKFTSCRDDKTFPGRQYINRYAAEWDMLIELS